VNRKILPGIGCILLVLLACAAGCAQNENAGRQRAAERISKEEVARTEAARPRVEIPPPLPELAVVPSQGDCAPPADNLTFFGSCCNGQSCNGQCVAAEANRIACSCFGVAGGCPQGKVCCKLRRGCVLPNDCEAP
jgi:hypothetical protein